MTDWDPVLPSSGNAENRKTRRAGTWRGALHGGQDLPQSGDRESVRPFVQRS